jgi:hypothetical protein
VKVTKIVNDCVRSGANWSQSSVELDNGQIVRVFNPVMVGDTVYSEVKDGYTNWKIKKAQASVGGDAEKLINQMSKDIQTLFGRVSALESELGLLKLNNIETESQVSGSDDMPDDFLKISNLEDK